MEILVGDSLVTIHYIAEERPSGFISINNGSVMSTETMQGSPAERI